MPVVTLSRLTGSGGSVIGHKLAERLGAVTLDTQIIVETARRLGISEAAAARYDERADSFIDRLTRILAVSVATFAPVDLGEAPSYESLAERDVTVVREMIRETAKTGNAVILGHGAQYLLAGEPGVLHVRCVAPLAYRVQRMMRLRTLTQAQAEKFVRQEDDRRTAYTRQFYHADWRDPAGYHLTLNTSVWGEENCVTLILDALKLLPEAQATTAAQS